MTFGNYVACLQIRHYRIDYSTNISTVLSNGYVSVKIYKSTLVRERMNGILVYDEKSRHILAATDDTSYSDDVVTILKYEELKEILLGEPEKIIPRLRMKHVEKVIERLEG